MSHRKSDLGIPRPRKSAKVVLGREPINGLSSDQRKDDRSWAKSGLRSNSLPCSRRAIQRRLASAAGSGHSGFAIGLFNRRGVTARMPTDGGGQERD